MKYAEQVTENVQNALWQALREYDQVMEDCPEDVYDPGWDHIQDLTCELTPKLMVLGEVLGYDANAMETVMALIDDYHHYELYQSDHIDEARRSEYDRLHEWLSLDQRTKPFQDVVLTGVVCHFGNERKI